MPTQLCLLITQAIFKPKVLLRSAQIPIKQNTARRLAKKFEDELKKLNEKNQIDTESGFASSK